MGIEAVAVAIVDGRFARWMEYQGFARTTRSSRARHVTQADRWLVMTLGRHLARANEDHIRAFLEARPSPGTRNSYRSDLTSFFDYCVEAGIRANDPMARIRRYPVPQRLPRPLSLEEIRRLRIGAASISLRHRVVVDLALYAGPRRAEMARLKWSDVDLEGHRIRFMGKGSKEGIVPIHPSLVPLLELWHLAQPSDEWVFPSTHTRSHITGDTIRHIVREAGHRAGVNAAPHRLRHSFATQLFELGADSKNVADLLRHANLASVQIYTKVSMTRLEPDLNKLSY